MEVPALHLAVDVPEFLYYVNGKWIVQKMLPGTLILSETSNYNTWL